jgi:hypothetical protein
VKRMLVSETSIPFVWPLYNFWSTRPIFTRPGMKATSLTDIATPCLLISQ